MSFDFSWIKISGLQAAQSAAHAFTGVIGGNAVSAWSLDWHQSLGIAAGAALVSFLSRVVAYQMPSDPVATVSGPTGAQTLPAPSPATVVAPLADVQSVTVGCAPGK